MNNKPIGEVAALAWLFSLRHDVWVVLLVALGVLAWTWEREGWIVLGGSAVGVLLWVQMLALVQQGRIVRPFLPPTGPLLRASGPAAGLGVPLLLGSGVATMLVGRAAWLLLPSRALVAAVVALVVGWQVWLFFWATMPAEARKVAGDG